MSSRDFPSAIADSTSSRFAMLLDAGIRTRTSRSGWRNAKIGRGVTGQGIMAMETMRAFSCVPLLVCAMVVGACDGAPSALAASGSPSAKPSASKVVVSPAAPPIITFDPPRDTSQAPRFIAGRWASSLPLLDVQFSVTPEPLFACAATVDADKQGGTYACDGLLPPAMDMRLDLTGTTPQGVRVRATRNFRTMADRRSAVPWFTDVEDPPTPPPAWPAPSVRVPEPSTPGR